MRVPAAAVAATLGVLAAAAAALLWPGSAPAQEQPPAPAAAPAPEPPTRAFAWLAWRRAVWSHESTDYARALKELEDDRSKTGGSFLTDFMLAQTLAQLRSPDHARRAADVLAPVERAQPGFPGVALVKAMLLTQEKAPWQDQPGARPSLELLDRFVLDLASYPREAPLSAELRFLGHVERGCRRIAIAENDQAFRDLEEALRMGRVQGRPTSAQVLRILVQANLAVRQGIVADQLAEQAMRQAPGEPTHYFVRAIVAAESGRMDDSRTWQLRALELKRDYAEPYAKLAFLAFDPGNDMPTMRRRLETYQSLFDDRWSSPGMVAPANDRANLLAGWGLYWFQRGHEAINAGRTEEARAHWKVARDRFLEAYQAQPGCVRAIQSLIQVLSLLRAPAAEIEVWTRRAEEIKDPAGGGDRGFRDTFCRAPGRRSPTVG